jgi:tripartite-type tricarboxylate transporter receptor subunit TctC
MQWFALLGPKGLPSAIVARWNDEIERILQSSDVRQRMVNDGLDPAGGPPSRFRDVLESEIQKWRQVVAAAGINPARY